MANISEVTLPNGNDYDIKAKYLDSTARNDILSMASKINETVVTTPYVKKIVPSGQYTEKLKKIIGASVVWNQMVKNGNFADTSNWTATRGTFSVASNVGKLTAKSASAYFQVKLESASIGFLANNVYRVRGRVKSSNTQRIKAFVDSIQVLNVVPTAGSWVEFETIIKPSASASGVVSFGWEGTPAVNDTLEMEKVCVTNLTSMFGSTIADYVFTLETQTAGSGIAWLKSYGFFTEDYYAYSANTMQSVSVSGKKNYSRNLVNISGRTIASQTTIASGIELKKGTYTASIKAKNNANIVGYFRINSGGAISIMQITIPVGADGRLYSTFTVEEDTTFNVICNGQRTGYNYTIDEIMIEVGSVMNEYSPYGVINETALDHTTLRGIFKLDANNNLYADGDTYPSDGSGDVKYEKADLGSLEWVKSETNYSTFYCSPTSSPLYESTISVTYQSEIYDCVSVDIASSSGDNYIYVNTYKRIVIKDTSKSNLTPAQFAEAISGKYFLYKKDTPTTATFTPYASLQTVEIGGTEKFIDYGVEQETRDVAIPVGNETAYGDNPIIAEYIKYVS